MSEIMLRCENVSKQYRLGAIGGTTLREDLQRLSARLRKKEDPTSKIGQKKRPISNEKFLALDGVSFEVKKGEAVGIIGKNGAGKSTLLKLITRITGPSKGTISLNGRVASMLEVGTGFHPELTGRENIYMNGAILGMTKKEIDAKIEEIIEFSEVRQFIDTPVKRYSSGMYVKLAFSVAAHLDSEIVIMDEVLAVGDMAFQNKCLTKMRQSAQKEGKTVLYVSHNMNTIRQLCDRVIVLDKGKLVFDGDVEEGIAIYMGQNTRACSTLDLSQYNRMEFLMRDDIRLTWAEYIGKNDIIFQRGEKINLRIKWKNNADIKNIGFRFVVYSAYSTHVCASFAYDLYSGEKGKEGSADLQFDPSILAPGTYLSYYVFYFTDGNGGCADIDQIRGMDFVIDSAYDSSKLVWRKEAWGFIEMPSPKVVNVTDK